MRHATIKFTEARNGELYKKKGGPEGPPRMVQSIQSAYNRSTSKAPSWKAKKDYLNVNLSDPIIFVVSQRHRKSQFY